MRRLSSILPAGSLALLTLAAAPASAQTAATLARPAQLQVSFDDRAIQQGGRSPFQSPPMFQFGYRVYGSIDVIRLTASKTFNAVIGKDQITAFGAGFEITGRACCAFFRFAFSHSKEDGSRGFVFDGEFIPNGIAMEVEQWPLELGGGWRQELGKSRRVAVYGGGGVIFLNYQETSDLGDDEDNASDWLTGWSLFGGADVDLHKGFFVGGEVQYRSITKDARAGGILEQLDEKDLGGVAVRLLIGFRK
jgi:opacity protein-like surface antigen